MIWLLLVSICFILSYYLTKSWIEICFEKGLVSVDVHKKAKREVPRIGALPSALISTFLALLSKRFGFRGDLVFLTSSTSILMGLIDDSISLKDSEKVIIPAISFIPIGLYINEFELFGISFKGPWPLILSVLLGSFSSNATNTLAGFNGLEAGLSVIIGSFLSFEAFLVGRRVEAIIFACFSACYSAFLLFNYYPAKAFPGNCSTFQMGAFLASSSILANLQTPFILLMTPHALDFFLKLISWRKMKEKVPSLLDKDGLLRPPPHLSLPSLLLRMRRMSEKGLVSTILLIEALICLVVSLVYFPR